MPWSTPASRWAVTWASSGSIRRISRDKKGLDELTDVDGIIVPGGFGSRGGEGKISCVKYARENALPYLGLCLGFQMAVIEYARNVCGLKDANSTEIDPDCPEPVIDILPEQKKIEGLGGNMRLGGRNIEIKPQTLAWNLFGQKDTVRMRFRHRYEVDPKYIEILEKNGLVFSGKAPDQPIMQILELPQPSVLHRHAGASVPDEPAAASASDVRRPGRRRDAPPLSRNRSAQLHRSRQARPRFG